MGEIEKAQVERSEAARTRMLAETGLRPSEMCSPTTLTTKHPVTHNIYYVK
jgi:hypothetical protein